ncbi:MAG: ABC transporter ATP-binding protein, partial [Mycobacteriaceae bacterium]
MSGRRSVLWRAAVLLRPAWVRLFAGALAAAAASGCAVALMATSAWLIARAAQHPPVLTLMVAI